MGAGAHIHGSCHCGAVRVSVQLSRAPEAIELRACQCSFCRRHGARTFADPAGSAVIESETETAIHRYRFGVRTADFLLCAHCGVYIVAVIDTPGGHRATINAAGLGFAEFDGRGAVASHYDAESRDERVERRHQRWMPVDIRICTPAAVRQKEACG
jgi:hypothetical protein